MVTKSAPTSLIKNSGTTHPLRHLQLTFTHPLRAQEIPQWRGAWAQLAGREYDYFHNHQGQTAYHYRYPLVQYGVDRSRASLTAWQDGVGAVQQVLADRDWTILWKGEKVDLRIADLQMKESRLTFLDQPKTYRLRMWLPFNTQNFNRWGRAEALVERVELLNTILVGQLLSFFTGVGWQLPQRLEAEIVNIDRIGRERVHGTLRPTFDVRFRCNVDLPDGVRLGKAVAMGFGRVACQFIGEAQKARPWSQ